MPSPEETSISVEYLTTARLGEKGQITLPKAYRDTVALEIGAPAQGQEDRAARSLRAVDFCTSDKPD